MPRDSGQPETDAQFEFSRERRRRALSRLSARIRGETSDVSVILPFEEVVEALGRRGERHLGVQLIDLDSIVGTVDRGHDFDRNFRPTTGRARRRWEGVATAQKQGKEMPPIDVYRIGAVHFVRDGHHRVSIARAQRLKQIDADVTEIVTEVGAERDIKLSDLPLKSHERLFHERVPLPPELQARIAPSNRSAYACLAEGVEAWGFRKMQAEGCFLGRDEVAKAWFREDYEPVVEMLREVGLAKSGSETDAYMATVTLRYLLLRTHDWDEAVLDSLRDEMERPSWENTEVRRLRKAIR